MADWQVSLKQLVAAVTSVPANKHNDDMAVL